MPSRQRSLLPRQDRRKIQAAMAYYASILQAAVAEHRARIARAAQDDIGINYGVTVRTPPAGHPSIGATRDATRVTRPAGYPPAGATSGFLSNGATPSVSGYPVNGGDHPQRRHLYPPYAPSPVRRSLRSRLLGCVRPRGAPPPVGNRPSRPPPPPYFNAATMENWAHDQTWTQPDDHRRRGRAPPARSPSPPPSPPSMPTIPIWGGPLPSAQPVQRVPAWEPYFGIAGQQLGAQQLMPPLPAAGTVPIRYPSELLQAWRITQPVYPPRTAVWAAALQGANFGLPARSVYSHALLVREQANIECMCGTQAHRQMLALRRYHGL